MTTGSQTTDAPTNDHKHPPTTAKSHGLTIAVIGVLCLLVVTALSNLFLALVPLASPEYFWGYVLAQPLSLIADIFVVLELFHSTMASYPGIQSAAMRILRYVIALSTLGSVALTAASWDRGIRQSHTYYFLVANQAVQFGMAMLVIGLLLFLSRYPIRLPRNTYVSCYFFSAVFLVEAADNLLAAATGRLHGVQADRTGNQKRHPCSLMFATTARWLATAGFSHASP